MKDKRTRYELRTRRTRDKIRKAGGELPRLSVHRSLKYFYAQVIDDRQGKTVAFVCSRGSSDAEGKARKSLADAQETGKRIAEVAMKAGVKRVVFDRGGRVYHGRIKALADAARAAGLTF
ncbi:MAG: 50S ribosomal protein L18 [Elusimicrobiota bacterium]